MMEIRKRLALVTIMPIIISLALVLVFEFGILEDGLLAGTQPLEFIVLTIMELLTIALIPTAVMLFKIKKIKQDLAEDSERALMKWGSLRLTMIGDALIFNIVFYYLFLAVAFAYLAIVLFLALIYLFPTKGRCDAELNHKE